MDKCNKSARNGRLPGWAWLAGFGYLVLYFALMIKAIFLISESWNIFAAAVFVIVVSTIMYRFVTPVVIGFLDKSRLPEDDDD